MNILMALMMLSMAFVMISMSAASAKRIVEVLDETTDLPAAKAPGGQPWPTAASRFDHVTFKYKHGSGQPVLNDITFTIKPGETLGIIGGTGSAKSSLVQLIPRLYDAGDRHRQGRRRGCPRLQPRRAPPRGLHGAAEERPVLRHHPRQPALGRRERQRGRVHPGGQAGLRR